MELSEPDLVVTAADAAAYVARHPQGNETRLVIEVSDSTLRFDQTTKGNLYARAGVPEYWVVDLTGAILYLHRRPLNGRYTQIINASGAESISPEAMPEAIVSITDFLPPS